MFYLFRSGSTITTNYDFEENEYEIAIFSREYIQSLMKPKIIRSVDKGNMIKKNNEAKCHCP